MKWVKYFSNGILAPQEFWVLGFWVWVLGFWVWVLGLNSGFKSVRDFKFSPIVRRDKR